MHLPRRGMSVLRAKRLLGWTPSRALAKERHQHAVGGGGYAACWKPKAWKRRSPSA